MEAAYEVIPRFLLCEVHAQKRSKNKDKRYLKTSLISEG